MREYESPEAFLRTMDVLEHSVSMARQLRGLGYPDDAARVEALYEKELGITVHEREVVREQIQQLLAKAETTVDA